jgi:hypothetical protein
MASFVTIAWRWIFIWLSAGIAASVLRPRAASWTGFAAWRLLDRLRTLRTR